MRNSAPLRARGQDAFLIILGPRVQAQHITLWFICQRLWRPLHYNDFIRNLLKIRPRSRKSMFGLRTRVLVSAVQIICHRLRSVLRAVQVTSPYLTLYPGSSCTVHLALTLSAVYPSISCTVHLALTLSAVYQGSSCTVHLALTLSAVCPGSSCTLYRTPGPDFVSCLSR